MKKKLVWHFTILLVFITNILTANNVTDNEIKAEITGELKKWHKITLTFVGPETSEMDKLNPFMAYRLDVYFTHKESGKTLKVQGYFAADGNAGESSATSGNKWRVNFAPEETGTWSYKVDFRVGNWQAVSERKNAGESAGFMDGAEGSFFVEKSDKTGRDNRAKGRLQYDGTRYLKYAETGKPMLKVGPDSPENFLAYADFDGTFHNDGHKDNLVKTWEAHIKDWKEGDPTWQNGKGKAIIGAVNYLASKGMNVFSFLTMNIVGDDQNVFPFVDYDTHDRFDCSKLDQWEVVFEHADKLGMFLHFKLLEQECQGLLDNGAIGAYTRLFYREMLARFGHHLSLNWNVGEESGDWAKDHKTPPMNTTQRLAAAEYFHQNDPYRHHIVIHNPPSFDDILGTAGKYTGVSYQLGTQQFRNVHETILKWLNLSKEAGKQWAISMDEPGGAQHALLPDVEDAKHDSARINSLWGSFLAGAWGNEFYFGYDHPHSDLTCEDFRSRDLFWNQCKYLLDFFEENQISVAETENYTNLVQKGDYCLANPGKMYIVFLRNGNGTINLENQSGEFSVKWFDPRNGGELQTGSIKMFKAGKIQELKGAPSEPEKDWVVLLRKDAFAETTGVFYDSTVEQMKFAATDVQTALVAKGYTVEMLPLSSLSASYANKKVVIALASNSKVTGILTNQGGTAPSGLGEQAYALRTTRQGQTSYWALGGDVNGAMYGGLQIAENISFEGFSGVYNNQESPFMLNRGMKLNMPFDRRIPTYVGGWTSNSTKKAIPHVWDMSFWKKLIDQQARYRYNMLSVWVHHPFPALVKLPDYPKASLPNIEGFDGYVKELNHEQRVAFWREVMQYAHSRGMKFYFFNWNVYLDYAKDQYPDITAERTNTTTLDYMYKSMQALIETYPDLDGFGISAGDGMMNESQGFNGDSNLKTQWTWDAMGKAVKDYVARNPSRKFNLIHRGIGSSPEIVNEKYAPLKDVKNVTLNYSHKYAQAHMYSTPTPKWTNSIQSCTKLGMKSWVTIRNDDYFYFNWGDPEFVRAYMYGIPDKETVTGMYIGSDGYTPSRTYFCKNDAMNGQLEVERRWYMEMLWGRISYNPQISEDVFKNMLAKRFPAISADNLFQAWSLASRALPKVTELIMGKWSLDFHWYPEGCWSDPGRGTGFRTIDGFANETTVAKGSNLCDIANSAAGNCESKKSSYEVADEMQADAEKALSLISNIKGNGNADLEMAINNVKQMASLGVYYAHKVRGATYKKAGQTAKAQEEMAKAYCWWISYTRLMENTYYGDSFRNHSILPDWKYADATALKEYTDLGGVGVPDCK